MITNKDLLYHCDLTRDKCFIAPLLVGAMFGWPTPLIGSALTQLDLPQHNRTARSFTETSVIQNRRSLALFGLVYRTLHFIFPPNTLTQENNGLANKTLLSWP